MTAVARSHRSGGFVGVAAARAPDCKGESRGSVLHLSIYLWGLYIDQQRRKPLITRPSFRVIPAVMERPGSTRWSRRLRENWDQAELLPSRYGESPRDGRDGLGFRPSKNGFARGRRLGPVGERGGERGVGPDGVRPAEVGGGPPRDDLEEGLPR